MKHRRSTRRSSNRTSSRFLEREFNGKSWSSCSPQGIHIICRVYDILSGVAEADKVLYKDTDPEYGYVLLPDMKWDQVTEGSLYLVAITLSAEIRSLRDLRKKHVGMLKNIRTEAGRVVQEKWGMGPGSLRMFIHYQPSYCKRLPFVNIKNMLTS